jgi:hypothetical protein
MWQQEYTLSCMHSLQENTLAHEPTCQERLWMWESSLPRGDANRSARTWESGNTVGSQKENLSRTLHVGIVNGGGTPTPRTPEGSWLPWLICILSNGHPGALQHYWQEPPSLPQPGSAPLLLWGGFKQRTFPDFSSEASLLEPLQGPPFWSEEL